MSTPIIFNLPHQLGRVEAHRIEAGFAKFVHSLPGGAGGYSERWANCAERILQMDDHHPMSTLPRHNQAATKRSDLRMMRSRHRAPSVERMSAQGS